MRTSNGTFTDFQEAVLICGSNSSLDFFGFLSFGMYVRTHQNVCSLVEEKQN